MSDPGPELPPRSRAATSFMAVPILFGALLLAAGLAVFALGRLGGQAEGERLVLSFEVACEGADGPVLSEAELATGRLLNERATEIGLGEPHIFQEHGTLAITATMPGLADDREAIPALLAQTGQLELRLGDQVLATRADLVEARLRLDESGLPITDLVLAPSTARRLRDALQADPSGTMEIVLDGEVLAERPNSVPVEDDVIKLLSGEGMTRDRMRRAADRGIVLNHGPLPCAVRVRDVQSAASEG